MNGIESKCLFTQLEYERFRHLFYALPDAWGEGTLRPPFARIWKTGGIGAGATIPVVGLFANTGFAKQLRFPMEKVARLAGVDTETVRRAARALHELSLATSRTVTWRGIRLTEWSLADHLAVQLGSSSQPESRYFYFAGRLIFGGNWACLTAVQRMIYLAVATKARSFSEPVEQNDFLRYRLRPHTQTADLLDAYAVSSPKSHLRLATISYTELQQLTGISLSALKQAVKLLKRREVWGVSHSDEKWLAHAPLTVYPTDGGSLLYHFRDHAKPWPWDLLNAAGEQPT